MHHQIDIVTSPDQPSDIEGWSVFIGDTHTSRNVGGLELSLFMSVLLLGETSY